MLTLLYDQTFSGALGKFIAKLDAIEVLATAAYIILGIWGKSNGLPMPFWKLISLGAGYHIVLRPLLALIFNRLQPKQKP
jgi:hypothetical protein